MERFSARLLVFLAHLPQWVPLLVALGLLITGFIVPGLIGAAALLLVAIFLGWLGYMSWPQHQHLGTSHARRRDGLHGGPCRVAGPALTSR